MMHTPAVRLVTWLLVFAALLFVLDRAAGTAVEQLYNRLEVGEGAGHGRYSSLQTSAEFVVLGSSRARNHVDAAHVEALTGLRAYNAGANGQGLYYARAMQLALQARNADVRLLLVHVSPGDLYAPETGRAAVLLPLAGLSDELGALFAEMDPWFKAKSFSKIYRYNALILPILMNVGKTANVEARGFLPREGVMLQPELGLLTRADATSGDAPNGPAHDTTPAAVSVKLLDAMIRDAAARDYQIVLFTAPYFEGDARWPGDAEMHQREQQSAEWLRGYAATQNVLYVSFNDGSVALVHEPTAFKDSVHLRPHVTTAFTTLLVERLSPVLSSMGATGAEPAR